MDIIDIALAKNFAKKMAAGFTNVEVDGMTINFTLIDGSTVSLTVPTPADGVSVTDLEIDENGDLICTMSDGTETNAGKALPQKGVDYFTPEEVEEIKEEISTELQEEINLLNSNFEPKTIIPSDNIKVTDSASGRIQNFTTIGKTKQLTSTGKNMFDKDTATYDLEHYINESGVITSSSISGYTTSYVAVEPETNYTIQGTLTSGINVFGIYYYDSNKNWISRNTRTVNDIPFTFTTPENCAYIQFQFLKSEYTGDDIMIELGDTAHDYEPYTDGEVAPSPEHTQPLNNVTGNIVIDSSNENLFSAKARTVTSHGVTVESFDNSSEIYINGTNNSTAFTIRSTNYMYLKPRTYTIYVEGLHDEDKLYLRRSDQSKYLVTDVHNKTPKTFIISTPEVFYLAISLTSESSYNNEKIKVCIKEGNTNTSYFKHKGKRVTFPLSTGQKMYEGDFLAEDGIHHVKKQIIFDGTENWILQNASVGQFQLGNNDITNTFAALCNTFECKPSYASTGKPYIRVGNKKIFAELGTEFLNEMTAEAWKAWLTNRYINSNPVILEASLAEEEIEPYTEAQQTAWNELQKLETYKNITIVYTNSNDLSPDANFIYLVDPTVLINSRLDALEAQA